jgi:hypothetical protein
MKITLRKANAVQAAINDEVASLDLTTDVSVNEFHRPTEVLTAARDMFFANKDKRTNLLAALYDIRRDVARANATAGVNDMLTQVAHLEKEIGYITKLSKTKPQLEKCVLDGKLGKIRARDSSASDTYRYGETDDSVKTTIFKQAEIEQFRKQVVDMKKRKLLLQDALLELNVKTEIEIDTDSLPVLTKAGIL